MLVVEILATRGTLELQEVQGEEEMEVVVELVHPTPESSLGGQAGIPVETLAHPLVEVRFNLLLLVELVRQRGAPGVYPEEELNQWRRERAGVEVDLDLLVALQQQEIQVLQELQILGELEVQQMQVIHREL